MIGWRHFIYLLVIIFFGIHLLMRPEFKEDLEAMRPYRQKLIKRSPTIAKLLVWAFPIMNLMITLKEPDAFHQNILFQFINAWFFCFMIQRSVKRSVTKVSWPWIVSGVVFIVYTFIKNIIVCETFIGFLFVEAHSLATAIFFFFASYCIPNPAELRSREAEKAAWEAFCATEEGKQYVEAERRRLAEAERNRQRIMASITNGTSQPSRSSTSTRQTYTVQEVKKCCNNCKYYSGNFCFCAWSNRYEETIVMGSMNTCRHFTLDE